MIPVPAAAVRNSSIVMAAKAFQKQRDFRRVCSGGRSGKPAGGRGRRKTSLHEGPDCGRFGSDAGLAQGSQGGQQFLHAAQPCLVIAVKCSCHLDCSQGVAGSLQNGAHGSSLGGHGVGPWEGCLLWQRPPAWPTAPASSSTSASWSGASSARRTWYAGRSQRISPCASSAARRRLRSTRRCRISRVAEVQRPTVGVGNGRVEFIVKLVENGQLAGHVGELVRSTQWCPARTFASTL